MTAPESLRSPVVLPLVALALVAVACGGDPGAGPANSAVADTGNYVVERSEADGVETVRTVSGSRWGGNPRLIEELSIGEEVGDDALLFGAISASWATGDRIYAVDTQIPAVRAFDHQGNFLHQVGGLGQGPGEYSRPIGLAVDGQGRVLVTDLQGARLNIYDSDGNRIEDWPLGTPQAALGLQVSLDGEVFTRVIELPSEISGPIELKEGMRRVGPDGHQGDPFYPPEIEFEQPTVKVEFGDNSFDMAILPFTPSYQWAFAPGGEMIAGVGNEYRIEIHAGGGTVRVIEKAWIPVPVNPDERSFRAEMAAQPMRRMAPELTIPESDVPAHKPAFTRLTADRNGRLWVTRQGPSEIDPDCRETSGAAGGGVAIVMGASGDTMVRADPGGDDEEYDGDCWRNTWLFDVFEIDSGEFLGTVAAPEPGFTQVQFVDDDVVLGSVTDELGTVRLKKYRLVID